MGKNILTVSGKVIKASTSNNHLDISLSEADIEKLIATFNIEADSLEIKDGFNGRWAPVPVGENSISVLLSDDNAIVGVRLFGNRLSSGEFVGEHTNSHYHKNDSGDLVFAENGEYVNSNFYSEAEQERRNVAHETLRAQSRMLNSFLSSQSPEKAAAFFGNLMGVTAPKVAATETVVNDLD